MKVFNSGPPKNWLILFKKLCLNNNFPIRHFLFPIGQTAHNKSVHFCSQIKTAADVQ